MLKRVIRTCFSSEKYFIDQKYQNVYIQTSNKLGSLNSVSSVLLQNNVNTTYIKSQIANSWTKQKKYGLDISIQKQSPEKIELLKNKFYQMGIKFNPSPAIKIPWFPRTIKDLDLIGKVLLNVKDQVNKDHPQFADKQYRKRRDFIAKVALQYRLGNQIPDIPYTKQQNQLWKNIYAKLNRLHQKGMSKRFLNQLNKLQKQFMFSKRIPQLNQLNQYLKNRSGFTLKPTHGILSQREFLNCFAFRVFCCTQYLRHTGTPDYTPQPDIVHEIVGHIPMFADPDVAELSQYIGLLSLGATDEQVAQLGTLYWFTLQFGACLEDNKTLGYGAGIASSIAQITNLISGNPRFQMFNPSSDWKTPYTIQDVQQFYKVTKSFDGALLDLQQYGKTVLKPVTTTFNFANKTIQYDRNIQGVDVGDKPIQFV